MMLNTDVRMGGGGLVKFGHLRTGGSENRSFLRTSVMDDPYAKPSQSAHAMLSGSKDIIQRVLPKAESVLQHFSLMVANCNAEMSIPKLKWIKNVLQTVLDQEKLSMLRILSTDKDKLTMQYEENTAKVVS